MILSNTTYRTTIRPSSFDKPGEARETAFQLAGETHPFVFDGKVEDAVVGAMMEPEKAFTGLDQLKQVCQDSDGKLAHARALIQDGADTVKVDVGKSDKWTMKATDKPGFVEISNDGGLGGEQSIRLGEGYVSLRTRPQLMGSDESLSQKVVGKWNAAEGTITCVSEEIERTVKTEAPAPLPKPAPPVPSAPPRPGKVVTDLGVDARVLTPVSREVGADRVFSGFNDENLQRFCDWSFGKIDLPFGQPLNALPEGWQELGDFDSYGLGKGENYMVGNPGGSYQVLNLNKEDGTVKLATHWSYYQPGNFEGSFEQVTLTRYPDGEVRREARELHD